MEYKDGDYLVAKCRNRLHIKLQTVPLLPGMERLLLEVLKSEDNKYYPLGLLFMTRRVDKYEIYIN